MNKNGVISEFTHNQIKKNQKKKKQESKPRSFFKPSVAETRLNFPSEDGKRWHEESCGFFSVIRRNKKRR